MKTSNNALSILSFALLLAACATGFSLGLQASVTRSFSPSTTSLHMTDNLFRAARSAGADDNVVELMRPLGLVLKQDDETGNVYVDKIAPKGNAARSGKVCAGCACYSIRSWYRNGAGVERTKSETLGQADDSR